MARVQEQPERASDDDGDEHLSSSGSESSGYISDSSRDEEENEEEEEDAEAEATVAAAKKQRVQADIDEMCRMMADMDTIKARLQQRLAAERQARQQRLEREDRERVVQDAARPRAKGEACCRQEEAGVQMETKISQQQMNVSQQSLCPPHLACGASGTDAALSAVDGGAGFTNAAPKQNKPAGLSLYDLVKASGVGLSRKELLSPVRQVDPPAIPTRYSNDRVSPARQHQVHNDPSTLDEKKVLAGENSQLSHEQGSIVRGDSDSDHSYAHDAAGYNPARGHPALSKTEPSRHYDENSASVSNSLVSSDAGNRSAVFPDLIRQRDHKFNAAALLSTGKRAQSAINTSDDDKTDEQREMEAIRCLLFGRSGRR
ncbi:hypothetical protein PRIC1_000752 [Phytophthora ramorum]